MYPTTQRHEKQKIFTPKPNNANTWQLFSVYKTAPPLVRAWACRRPLWLHGKQLPPGGCRSKERSSSFPGPRQEFPSRPPGVVFDGSWPSSARLCWRCVGFSERSSPEVISVPQDEEDSSIKDLVEGGSHPTS